MKVGETRLQDLQGLAKFRQAIKYVTPYFVPYKKSVWWVAVLSMLSNIFEPSLALCIKPFMYYVFVEHNLIVAAMVPFGLVGLFFIRESTTFLYEYSREKLSISVVQDLQCSVYDHFVHLSLDHYDKLSTGELMSRTIRDTSHMQNTVPMVIDFCKHSIKLVALAAVCFYMQPMLTAIAFIVIPLTAYPVSRIGAAMKKFTKRGLKQAATINVQMQETYAGARIVKAFSQEDNELRNYRGKMNKMLELQLKYARSKYLQGPITNMISVLGVALVLGIASWWAVTNVDTAVSSGWWFFIGGVPVRQTTELLPRITEGSYFAFFVALGMMIVPVRDLARVQGNIQTTYGAVERVVEAFEKRPTVVEAPDAVELPAMDREIRCENVKFKYLDQMVLKDFNLTATKGELIALVGPSGSGKTTVVNLLSRFYEVTGGKITIDGVDIRKATLRSLRRQIGIVSQETFLFNDSVENNIKYGALDRTHEEVVAAAQAANAHDFIEKLPAGYETIIGERGVRLSGGERQRLAIARALLRNPPILLLDEATSSLDTEAEREVQKALDNLMKNRTTIAIAHRLSTIRHADRIIVLSDGQIVEQGSHEDLLKNSGLYRRLYEMQFLIDETPALKQGFEPEPSPEK